MNPLRKSSRHGQRGAVLAEFAIVSLAFFTILFGVVDFGRALYSYHLVSESARMATRYAIVHGSTACTGASNPDPLASYVNGQAPVVGAGAMTVTTSCAAGGGCSASASPYTGCTVTVQVGYSFHFFVPIVSRLVIPMSSSSTMVISQ